MADLTAQRGCGAQAAQLHIESLQASTRPALIAVFHPGCMDLIASRFGEQGVSDCMESIADSLTARLQPEDSLYAWDGNELLAVCERSVREEQLRAELGRILARDGDITIRVGEKRITLRIPIAFSIFTPNKFSALHSEAAAVTAHPGGKSCEKSC